MKLVIFTPAKKVSSIGGCCALVSQELVAQGHEVTIVRTEIEGLLKSETHHFGAPVLPWTRTHQVTRVAEDADVLIYQIGDNYDFHKGGLEWLAALPGIVILHDFFLGHLFRAWSDSNRARGVEIVRAWYGEEMVKPFLTHSAPETFIEETKDRAPMIEWVCAMAHAVITHSSWGCERVVNSCAGPVRVVPLTYNKNLGSSLPGGMVYRPPGEKFAILTIGHVNANKRVESVIRALGTSPLLGGHSRYRLVGAIKPETATALTRLAKENGVDLVVSGEVDDGALLRAIEESDVISCLRLPSLEAASGSLVEALLNGKPTIVTDTGFYREIPSSCVMKIRPDNEVADIRSALEALFSDPAQREAMAAEGQRWALQTFTTENYVRELIHTIKDTMKTKPILNAVTYFSRVLAHWSADYDATGNEAIMEPLTIFGSSG